MVDDSSRTKYSCLRIWIIYRSFNQTKRIFWPQFLENLIACRRCIVFWSHKRDTKNLSKRRKILNLVAQIGICLSENFWHKILLGATTSSRFRFSSWMILRLVALFFDISDFISVCARFSSKSRYFEENIDTTISWDQYRGSLPKFQILSLQVHTSTQILKIRGRYKNFPCYAYRRKLVAASYKSSSSSNLTFSKRTLPFSQLEIFQIGRPAAARYSYLLVKSTQAKGK